MARQVIMAAEELGLEVFPDTPTCWHFNDKIAQKYLLDAVDAPMARTWVAYDLQSALQLVDEVELPVVLKLRSGAGSVNVSLVRAHGEARRLARQAFGKGFLPVGGVLTDAATRIRRARTRPDLSAMLLRLPRTLYRIQRARMEAPKEKGYLYLQEYLAGNEYDTRVTIIGKRAFAFTRNVRKGEFRASGSGSIDYRAERIDPRCISVAFEVARRVRSQSAAFDFASGRDGLPRILEVSFAYQAKAVYECPGHWDEAMGWYPGHEWPQDAILDDFLERLEARPERVPTGFARTIR
jgi:glutathione synthase/RimK-type ligase-like ATP-grasp enzyme